MSLLGHLALTKQPLVCLPLPTLHYIQLDHIILDSLIRLLPDPDFCDIL